MSQGLWKKWLISVTVLLMALVVFSGTLWYQLRVTNELLSDTVAQLSKLKAQLDTLKPEMELKAEQEQMLSDYASLREQINLRLGFEKDCQRFITPDDPLVSAKVQEITEGYPEDNEEFWRDYGRMFRWILENVEYSSDSATPILPESMNGTLEWRNDFWRLPAETINDGVGDCEDMSTLLASMLRNYNQRKFTVWIIGIETLAPVPKRHMAVGIPVDDHQLTIFDPSGRYYTPFPDLGGIGTQEVTQTIDHWATHLKEEMPDAQIYLIFSEDIYQEFSGTQEFVDWVYQS